MKKIKSYLRLGRAGHGKARQGLARQGVEFGGTINRQ